MRLMNAFSWNAQTAFEKRPEPMSKRRFVMQMRNILNAVDIVNAGTRLGGDTCLFGWRTGTRQSRI